MHGGFPLLSPQQKTASAVHENSPALKPGEGEAPPLRLVMLACPEEDAIFFPNESKRQRMSRQIIGRPRRLHSRLTATAPGSIEPKNVLRTFLLALETRPASRRRPSTGSLSHPQTWDSLLLARNSRFAISSFFPSSPRTASRTRRFANQPPGGLTWSIKKSRWPDASRPI